MEISTPAHWEGYSSSFLDGYEVSIPAIKGLAEKDVLLNPETGDPTFKYIYYSSVINKTRRIPFFTACNVYREHWLSVDRAGTFRCDHRLPDNYQLSDDIYTQVNKKQKEQNKKVDKGHLVKREDVQWDEDKDEVKAGEAARATFFYTNACPQHHQLNNELWKHLENSVLVKGRSKKPLKATVFTGPVFSDEDPLLVFPNGVNYEIKCPIRFWKVIYYINESDELRCAAFIMSHKLFMERDGHIFYEPAVRGMKPERKKPVKPFLAFEENEKYQVTLTLLSELTQLSFTKAGEGLSETQVYSKLSMPARSRSVSFGESLEIRGLVL